MAPKLSDYTIGRCSPNFSFIDNFINQLNIVVMFANALSLAFVLDRATTSFFFGLYETILGPNKIQKPLQDRLLSGQLAQSPLVRP